MHFITSSISYHGSVWVWATESLIDLSARKPSKVSMSGTVTGKSKTACFTLIIKDIAPLQIHRPISLHWLLVFLRRRGSRLPKIISNNMPMPNMLCNIPNLCQKSHRYYERLIGNTWYFPQICDIPNVSKITIFCICEKYWAYHWCHMVQFINNVSPTNNLLLT